jgi:hypothetical protein
MNFSYFGSFSAPNLMGFEATHLRPRNRAESAQVRISGTGEPAAGF